MAIPRYQTVIDSLVDQIASGQLSPGAMLPSEVQLGKDFGVAQGTARKALMELEARGLLERVQGRGTFVTQRTPETALFHFFRLRRSDGTLEAPNLEHEEITRRAATPDEKQHLFDAPDTVFQITRRRVLGDDAVLYEESVVSTVQFPGLSERAPLPNALYVLLQRAYGCIVMRAEESLVAEAATADVAHHLKVAPGTPVLAIERRAIDALDRVIELRRIVCRTEGYRYFVSLS